MDSPIILKTSWFRLIPHLIAIVFFSYLVSLTGLYDDWIYNLIVGWAFVLLYRLIIRHTVTKDHARGIKLVKRQRFEEAVEAFHDSLTFFKQHPSLDKWRSIIFLSPGKYGYREMAYANLGFVYGQLGDGEKAMEYYNKCLELNPKSGLAKSALNLINSTKKPEDESILKPMK